MFDTTFNNISVISWRSVLLMEETRVPGENHQPVASHWQTLSHNVVSSTLHHEQDLNSRDTLSYAKFHNSMSNHLKNAARTWKFPQKINYLTLRSKSHEGRDDK